MHKYAINHIDIWHNIAYCEFKIANERIRISLILEMVAEGLAARSGFEPPSVRGVRVKERHQTRILRSWRSASRPTGTSPVKVGQGWSRSVKLGQGRSSSVKVGQARSRSVKLGQGQSSSVKVGQARSRSVKLGQGRSRCASADRRGHESFRADRVYNGI